MLLGFRAYGLGFDEELVVMKVSNNDDIINGNHDNSNNDNSNNINKNSTAIGTAIKQQHPSAGIPYSCSKAVKLSMGFR